MDTVSKRLLTLEDILKLFRSRELTMVMDKLSNMQSLCKSARAAGKTVVSKFERDRLLEILKEAEDLCRDISFATAMTQIGLSAIHVRFGRTLDYSYLESIVETSSDMLRSEFWHHEFVAVPRSYETFVDNDALFGPEVKRAFPSAGPDIKEAGNCLAVGSSTAAVFHLMRAVEWGLRALACHLGMSSVRTRNRKGHRSYKPLSYSEWEHILNQLHQRVDNKIQKMQPGIRKQRDQEFYYPALQDIRAIRDAWRNHVMHVRREFNQSDAEAIKGHVERLLRTLATRIKES